MTNREINEKYLEIFILLVENVGEIDEDDALINIEEDFNANNKCISDLLENNAPFPVFIGYLLAIVLISRLLDQDTKEEEFMERLHPAVMSFYKKYIEKATRKFMSKYGIPQFNLEETITIGVKMVIKEDKNDRMR